MCLVYKASWGVTTPSACEKSPKAPDGSVVGVVVAKIPAQANKTEKHMRRVVEMGIAIDNEVYNSDGNAAAIEADRIHTATERKEDEYVAEGWGIMHGDLGVIPWQTPLHPIGHRWQGGSGLSGRSGGAAAGKRSDAAGGAERGASGAGREAGQLAGQPTKRPAGQREGGVLRCRLHGPKAAGQEREEEAEGEEGEVE
ncbi:hypothetical protein B0H14DRAFT_2629897 [Mycena olivaceomarginata]|nr:hypothetical protein B0H14DRAFT_2640100 [Mycena olivaceomarginata]KAJ7787008.1 hypothetical protein B0H14DRAFT_2629897 [Mycena olivaceomarginata]